MSFENIKPLKELLEKAKTPEDLSEFMKNIQYGFISKDNQKIYTPNDPDFGTAIQNEYFLQTPEELVASKHGLCWDQVELERAWFDQKNYNPQVYFLMFAKKEANNLPTHTFLTYEKDGKFYWFENSFGDYQGIHEYESLDDLIDDVKHKQFEYAQEKCSATDEDFENIKVCEYKTPKFGCSSEEFMKNMIALIKNKND